MTKAELVQMMVGRVISSDRRPRVPAAGKTVLAVDNLWCRDERALPALRGVSFEVRAGEVVGIAGVAGNGQTELAEVLSGLRLPSHGTFCLHGKDLTGTSPRRIRHAGLAHVPGDRLARGVDRQATIAANLLMGRHDVAPWSRYGLIDWPVVEKRASELMQQFDVRAPGPGTMVKSLSGGNMQKVVLAREFSNDAPLLLVDQPTRGVDIGATEAIHNEIMRQREEGKAILLISVQLDELIALADRILVMFAGRIMGDLPGDGVSEEALGLLMAGVVPDGAAATAAVA